MERLSIREASERFGLSRARLYQLLGDGIIDGELSEKRGRGACSWVDIASLQAHINMRDEKQRHGKGGGSGRPKIIGNGIYMPVVEAAKKSGYSSRHIDLLARQGSIASKQAKKGGRLVDYNDLINYRDNK